MVDPKLGNVPRSVLQCRLATPIRPSTVARGGGPAQVFLGGIPTCPWSPTRSTFAWRCWAWSTATAIPSVGAPIINGRYDPAAMADCGYPSIPQYLAANRPAPWGFPERRYPRVVRRSGRRPRVARGGLHSPRGRAARGRAGPGGCGDHRHRPRLGTRGPRGRSSRPGCRCSSTSRWPTGPTTSASSWPGRPGAAILSTSCMRYCREFAALRPRLARSARCG